MKVDLNKISSPYAEALLELPQANTALTKTGLIPVTIFGLSVAARMGITRKLNNKNKDES